MTTCVCPVAAYCERHQTTKNSHWHHLCQTRPDYFAAWERGRGLGQKRSPEERAKQKQKAKVTEAKRKRLVSLLRFLRQESDIGLGDTVERILARAGGRKIKSMIASLGGNCGCTERQQWLNRKYPY